MQKEEATRSFHRIVPQRYRLMRPVCRISGNLSHLFAQLLAYLESSSHLEHLSF